MPETATSPALTPPAKSGRKWLKILGIGLASAALAGVLFIVGVLWVIAASIGPAYPEHDGRIYLEKQGYSTTVIDRVVSREALDAATLEKLAGEDSTDVRFLVAQNAALPAPFLQRLTQDESDFVRGGAAQNPHLTAAQIQALSADESVTTQSYLARNPHVPEADLIRLHENHHVELIWFAMNPKCPAALKQKMIDTKDENALEWLQSQGEAQEESVVDRSKNSGELN